MLLIIVSKFTPTSKLKITSRRLSADWLQYMCDRDVAMGYRQNNVSNVGLLLLSCPSHSVGDIGEKVWNNMVNTHSGSSFFALPRRPMISNITGTKMYRYLAFVEQIL